MTFFQRITAPSKGKPPIISIFETYFVPLHRQMNENQLFSCYYTRKDTTFVQNLKRITTGCDIKNVFIELFYEKTILYKYIRNIKTEQCANTKNK